MPCRRPSPLPQHRLGDIGGVLQHALITGGRTNGCHDALTDAGNDRLLGGPADQSGQIGPHGDTRLGFKLNTILGHGINGRSAHRRGLGQSITLGFTLVCTASRMSRPAKINGAGPVPRQAEFGFARGDHGGDHRGHASAGQVVRFKLGGGNIQAGPVGPDARQHDGARVHLAQFHPDQLHETHFGAEVSAWTHRLRNWPIRPG